MKKLMALAFLPMPLVAAQPVPVTLAWDYPTNVMSQSITFNIYHNTAQIPPLSNWQLLTNVVGTNLSVTVSLTPGEHFFYVTASNFWQESLPSNIASTPVVPGQVDKLTIKRN